MLTDRRCLIRLPAILRFIGEQLAVLGLYGIVALEVSAQTELQHLDLSTEERSAATELQQIYKDRPSTLSIRVALTDGEPVDLALTAYQPFSPSRRVFLDGEVLDPSTYGGLHRYYRGLVVGDSSSHALVEINPEGELLFHIALSGDEYQGRTDGAALAVLRAASSSQRIPIDWPATDVIEADLETPDYVRTSDSQPSQAGSLAGARSESVPVTTGLYGPIAITVPPGQDYVGVVNRGPGIANTYVVPAGQSFNASYCEYSKCFIENPAAGDYDVYIYKFDSTNGAVDLPTTVNWNYGTSLATDELYALTLAIELDDALFAQFGSSASNVNTYLAQLVSYVSVTYEEELSTRLLIGDVFLYTSGPYANTTSTNTRLAAMRDYWRANRTDTNRGLAVHLGKISTFAGGLAYLDKMCDSSNGYSVSGVYGVAPTDPSQISWDAEVLAHELGHNVRSEHTHCYNGFEGNSNPVDACYSGEAANGCWAGAESLPGVGALTGGSASSQNGTIMSYCHLLTGGQDNLARTFGSNHAYGIQPARVPTRMSRRVSQIGVASGECVAVLGSNPTYVVTPSAEAGGSISPNSPQTVAAGDTADFLLTPRSGYQVSTVGGTCPAGSLSGSTYTTGAISADCTVIANFDETTTGTVPDAPSLSLTDVTTSSVTLGISPNGQGSSPIQSFTTSCEIQPEDELSDDQQSRSTAFNLGKKTDIKGVSRDASGNNISKGLVYGPTPELRSAQFGDLLSFTTPNGSVLMANVTSVRDTDRGNRILRAETNDLKITAVVNSNGHFFSSIQMPGQHYQSMILEGQTIMFDGNAAELAANPFMDDEVIPDNLPSGQNVAPNDGSELSANPTVVTVGVLYDSATAAAYDELALLDYYIDVANQSYQNSGVDIVFEVVAAGQFDPYLSQSDMVATLYDISCGSPSCSLGSTVNTAVMNWRDAYKADMLTQIVRYGTTGGTCGIAWRPSAETDFTYWLKELTYSVSAVELPGGSICPGIVMAHELGHNFGLGHDRATGCSGTYLSYACGYKVDGVFGTVMSYVPSDYYLTALSHPDVTYQGYPIGVPVGQSGEAFAALAVAQVDAYHEAIYTNSTTTYYTVTPDAGSGGSISPSTPQQVQSGSTTSFTITANSGYEISSVTGCSGSLSGSTYTTGAITQNCTVVANFSPVSSGYSVTYTITGMGSVSPGSPQTVSAGGTASFTLTPSSNYAIGSVGGTCPSGSVSGSIYTTGAINADCSIAFSFDQFKWEQTSANTSVTFNGLPSDTAFQCVSVATNAVGDSGPSAPVNFNTTGSSGSTPLPPTITSVTPGNGSLTVAFTPNASGPQADSYTATCVPSQADITAADVAMASQVQDKSDWHRSDAFKSGGHRCGADEVQARYQQLQPLASPAASTADCSLYNTSISSEYNPLSSGAYVIPVYWHVITTSGGGGNVTDANINAQMAVLNEDFAAIFDTTIQFELVGITRTANDGWFSDSPSDESAYKSALGIDPSRYLNIYTNDASGYLGYATFPADTAGTTLDGVVMNWAYVGGRNLPGASPYDLGRTLVHEVGHYLGLWHTFQGNGGTCANTFTSGDYIIDTWPHDTPDFGTSGSSVCGGITDIENFMNYSDDVAMIEFSSQQSNRMICSLINYRPQLYSIDTPGFTATGSGSPLTVTGLSNGTEYSCSVTASSASGDESAPSSAVLGTPAAQTVPQSPAITGSEAGDGEIMLFVTADDGGLPILEYEASCTDGVNTFTGSSTSSPVTVSGLENDTAYQCTVRARNALGWSGDSALTSPITPEGSFKGLPVWMIYEAIQ